MVINDLIMLSDIVVQGSFKLGAVSTGSLGKPELCVSGRGGAPTREGQSTPRILKVNQEYKDMRGEVGRRTEGREHLEWSVVEERSSEV